MLNVAEDHRRSGAGRALIAAAEERCRASGCQRIRLQLLTPKDFVHPVKVWLEQWYTQLGYVRQGDGEDFGKGVPAHPAAAVVQLPPHGLHERTRLDDAALYHYYHCCCNRFRAIT